jgi:hypothetical protein
MTTVEAVRAQLAGQACVVDVASLARGHIRIATDLRYPDGARIDVFVQGDGPLLQGVEGPTTLTDLGQTTAWLLDVGVRPWLSKKRSALIEDAVRVHGVERSGGELRLTMGPGETLPSAVLRLGQTCLRVADLTFTRRASLIAPFAEEVEEILGDAEIPYQAGVELPGRFGKLVAVDYLVTGKGQQSAILALTSSTQGGAHTVANEVFRRWFDLCETPGWGRQAVTIFDDRKVGLFRDDDLKRLELWSQVIGFSERGTIVATLAA